MDDTDEFYDLADQRMRYCDQCGPSVLAKMHGVFDGGEIKWCNHHANLHAEKFNLAGGFLYEIRSV